MKMPFGSSLLLVPLALILGTLEARARQAPELALSWDVKVEGGEYLADRGRAYRLFGERNEIELTMSLDNASDAAMVFKESVVKEAAEARLLRIGDRGDQGLVPITVTWVGVLGPDWPGPLVTLPDQEFVVEALSGVVWLIRVTRTDGGVFSAGEYRLEIALNNVRSAVRPQSGQTFSDQAHRQWSGRAEGGVEVVVQAPSTPRESAAMYMDRGHVAFSREQFGDALAFYAQAVEADATQTQALYYLGATYLRLGRYTEAIVALNKLPMPGDRGVHALALAQAYVGVGNETEALTLLGSSGFDEVGRAETMELMREFARARPAR